MPHFELFGLQIADIRRIRLYFERNALCNRYAALFSTYFERGGLQLQINGVDTVELKAALEYPEKYDHLIVRIGGFSMRFIELDRRAQEDFIRRFSNGM